MEQHYKRYKGSQKHFNLWMLSETEEFYPTQVPSDPLKKISEYIKSRPVYLPEAEKQVQKETKKKPTVFYKEDFNLISSWEKFFKGFNLELASFLGVKGIIDLASTCKYFKQALEDEAIWSYFLRTDFRAKMFENPRKEEKELRSIRLYYKYLYIKEKIGLPYHTGYFQAYGAPEVMELVDGMVDFMIPKRENIKGYVQEIMTRTKSKMAEIRLSWIKEKGEICLWNADFSVTVEEKMDELRKMKFIERTDKFYPCFVKKYLVKGIIEETYLLEDRFLVIKFLDNLEQVVFRVIDMDRELYSIAKSWSDSAAYFDYIIVGSDTKYEKKEDENSVSFMIRQENCGEMKMKMKLLKDNQVIFYNQNEKRFMGIYWDLKEKKELGLVQIDLETDVKEILCSKRENNGLLRSLILDNEMNVYDVEISIDTKEVKIQEILLPKEQKEEKSEENNDDGEEEEEEEEGIQEIGEKIAIKYANESKANRKKKYQNIIFSTSKKVEELGPNRFENQVRQYYHDIFTTQDKQEEWLIIHQKENFHFINLDKKELRNFYVEEGTGNLQQRNWNIYKDKLIILSSTHVFCHQISFEKQKVFPAFYREILIKDPPKTAMPWIFQDECFTIIVLAHPFFNTNSSKLSLIVTSTQEFFHNNSLYTFNKVNHLFLTNDVLDRPDRWEVEKENFVENLQMKFQGEKFFVLGERSSFYFDLSVISKQEKSYPPGWSFNIIDINNNIQKAPVLPVKTEELPKEAAEIDNEDKEKKPKGSKFVNSMKLEENRNGAGSKDKGNGWSKTRKSDLTRELDKEKKVVKGKGDKYYKNILQGKRSEKMN